MSELFNQYALRYTLSRHDYHLLKSLDTVESNKLQSIIEELYNANGELSIIKHLKDTHKMDELLADHVNVEGLSTAVYDDPYRLNILIPATPPHLKEHNLTKFSPGLGYTTRMRWQHYMMCAIHNLKAKGAIRFTEKVVVIVKYHFPSKNYDADNYAIKFINDAFKNSNLLVDDNCRCLSVHTCGIVDMEFKGTEITVVSYQNYINNPSAYI